MILPFLAPLSGYQILLLVFGAIVIIGLLSYFLVFLVLRLTRRRRFRNICGSRIHRLAMDNDYYLIQEFSFPMDDANYIMIDHFLLGERYLFCIHDEFYEGVIEGEQEDHSWVFYPRGNVNDKKIIKNPILQNRKRIEKLSLLTGIDQSLFISIVLFNNCCYLQDIKIDSRNEYIRNLKEIGRLVEAIEKRPIEKMEPYALEKAVADIARLKESYKKRGK